jgi:hypothetical protein
VGLFLYPHHYFRIKYLYYFFLKDFRLLQVSGMFPMAELGLLSHIITWIGKNYLSGMQKLNVAPLPNSLLTHILPP